VLTFTLTIIKAVSYVKKLYGIAVGERTLLNADAGDLNLLSLHFEVFGFVSVCHLAIAPVRFAISTFVYEP